MAEYPAHKDKKAIEKTFGLVRVCVRFPMHGILIATLQNQRHGNIYGLFIRHFAVPYANTLAR